MAQLVVYFNQKLRKEVNKMTTKYHTMLKNATHQLNVLEDVRDSAYDELYVLEAAEPYDDDAFEIWNEQCADYDCKFNDLSNLVKRLTAVVNALDELHSEYEEDELVNLEG